MIPLLLECDHSMVVIDPDGELFKATAERRRQMGHRCHPLDPFIVPRPKPPP